MKDCKKFVGLKLSSSLVLIPPSPPTALSAAKAFRFDSCASRFISFHLVLLMKSKHLCCFLISSHLVRPTSLTTSRSNVDLRARCGRSSHSWSSKHLVGDLLVYLMLALTEKIIKKVTTSMTVIIFGLSSHHDTAAEFAFKWLNMLAPNTS